MQTYKITYSETYTGETEIEAESNEEAVAKFNRIVEEEGLDSFKMRLEMSDSSVTAEEKPLELNEKERKMLYDLENLCMVVRGDKDGINRVKARGFIEAMMEYGFPHEPTEEWHYWTNGLEILAETEAHADKFADLLNFFTDTYRGYNDPVEDAENETTSANTGYWYIWMMY